MNILILFSGTKSFTKVFDKSHNIRTLDIDNHFNPTYNIDIMEWDYKKDLEDFKVDYLHASPICNYFTYAHIQRNNLKKRKMGYELIDKTIEIINWIKKVQNPKLKFTIENPKNKLTLNYEPLKQFKCVFTSYCQYGFLYRKDTTFLYGGFNLKLKLQCKIGNICNSKKLTYKN